MKIQKPIIKLWIIALAFYIFLIGAAWAVELIVPLPGSEKSETDPAVYVRNLYTFGIGLAALFAMAQIVFGGVQYTVSAGNPSLQGDAKDRILNAIYGLILLLSAFLILQTVNTKLTTLTIKGVEPLRQVDKFEYQSVSDAEAQLRKQHEDITQLVEAENKAKDAAKQAAEQNKKAAAAEKNFYEDPKNKEKLLAAKEELLKNEQAKFELAAQNLKFNQEKLKKSDQYIGLLQFNLEQQTDEDLRNSILQSIRNEQAAAGQIIKTITELKKDINSINSQIAYYEFANPKLKEEIEKEKLQQP